MSKLNVDQKTIMLLFSDKKSDFLIPDYQRPYAWEEGQCQTLWDDIFSFAFPDNNSDKFDSNEEYFLGSIVTFENDNNKKEVIDGQQRLTTLMLLLRAFYAKFGNMQDENSKSTRERIAQCLWKTNEFGQPNLNILKIDSEVATDNDKDEFLEILKTGIVNKDQKSNYAKNYRFFQEKIDNFLSEYPSYFAYLPARILGNCILLPIEAESQDTALRIFSTLNDRGLPLSDADIFKAQFYKHYSTKNQKDKFIEQWKELEEITGRIFKPLNGTPMDELFTRYMYFIRAKQGIKSSTTEALRKFYEKGKYSILKQDDTLSNLKILVDFWHDVYNQNQERFSTKILRKLFILNSAPNGMWTYFLSVYFLQNKNENNQLEENKLDEFLNKTIAFVWAFAFTNPGVNALRTPIYAEMVNIVTDKTVNFDEHKFDEHTLRTAMNNFEFKNGRPITRSMLTWWAFKDDQQEIPFLNTNFDIEHIFARKRQENDKSLSNTKLLEALGNKSLLEDKINIRASDYRFSDKIKYYKGFTTDKGQHKAGSIISELVNIADNKTDFTEQDIISRSEKIVSEFIEFLKEKKLIKEY
ncbi:DUF262 domain-containing protein [Cloacibacterium normanense]|nr:DUF262 domain-containing protein [Cloacibacterium normanense]AZI69226.1 DUF262 domain-containing protein [Cloacibacterium normanense]SDO67750.1 Protein of unknown function [Cloacibacterium normanense]